MKLIPRWCVYSQHGDGFKSHGCFANEENAKRYADQLTGTTGHPHYVIDIQHATGPARPSTRTNYILGRMRRNPNP